MASPFIESIRAAIRTKHYSLPTVLSSGEVSLVLSNLSGYAWLITALLYG